MKKIILSLTVLIILSASSFIYAQNAADTLSANQPFHGTLKLIGKSYDGSIVLRWAPTTPGAWSYANKVGYTLEKTVFDEEGKFDPEHFQAVNSTAIKPKPLEDWKAIVDNAKDKSYAAIAAQTLYGTSFGKVSTNIFDRADEYMNRYSFALLAADFSSVTAEALGLRYEDTNVEQGKQYVYRLFVAQPSATYHIDTAYFVIEKTSEEKIPKPVIGDVYEGEKAVTLKWEKALHQMVFTAYYVEKGDSKGRNFKRLNEVPFINPESDNVKNVNKMFQYTDSLEENYKKFQYRLVGITAFGELSEPSDPVIAMGIDRTGPKPPQNVKATPTGNNSVTITWEVHDPEPDLKGFLIGRGTDLKKDFVPVVADPLPKNTRSYIDHNADSFTGDYYVVAAVDTAGNGNISMVSYAAFLDSIPPAPPEHLTGKIDSTGIVTITWALGKERDLAGYMIYFTNSPDHIYSTVNDHPLADTVFTDTIQVKTLTEKIYYKIKAVDTHFNYSEYSDVLELSKPDLIRPTNPVFTDFKADEAGVHLSWIKSSSEDVVGYWLYRQTQDSTRKPIFVISKDNIVTNYVDKSVRSGLLYTYTIEAVDDAGLHSNPSAPIRIKMVDFSLPKAVDNLLANLSGEKRIQLIWSYQNEKQPERFLLYRSIDGSPFVTYKSIGPEATKFTDVNVHPGKKYDYTIKALFKNGKQSPFSNITSVVVNQ